MVHVEASRWCGSYRGLQTRCFQVRDLAGIANTFMTEVTKGKASTNLVASRFITSHALLYAVWNKILHEYGLYSNIMSLPVKDMVLK